MPARAARWLLPLLACGQLELSIDFGAPSYPHILHGKLGVGRPLAKMPDDPADYNAHLEVLDTHLAPAVFCLPIEWSSLRDPVPPLHGGASYLDPYPVYQPGSGGPVQFATANAHLQTLHAMLQNRSIMPMHFLMGALEPWYNNCTECSRIPPGGKRPYKDDRFPVPTNVTANGEAVGQWAAGYNASLTAVHWGIWQEAGHYLRHGRPEVAAPQYAAIAASYITALRPAGSLSARVDAQTLGLQLLPAPDTQPAAALGGDSFLGAVLKLLAAAPAPAAAAPPPAAPAPAAASLSPAPALDAAPAASALDGLDYIGFNQYSPRAGGLPPLSGAGLMQMNQDLAAARGVLVAVRAIHTTQRGRRSTNGSSAPDSTLGGSVHGSTLGSNPGSAPRDTAGRSSATGAAGAAGITSDGSTSAAAASATGTAALDRTPFLYTQIKVGRPYRPTDDSLTAHQWLSDGSLTALLSGGRPQRPAGQELHAYHGGRTGPGWRLVFFPNAR
jgi:hypothetical protein